MDVLNAFIKINSEKVLNEVQVLKCPLFYDNIKVGGTHIYYANWYKKGIKYINDLIKEDGEFYTLEEFISLLFFLLSFSLFLSISPLSLFIFFTLCCCCFLM